MRLAALFLCLAFFTFAPPTMRAQDPGAQQDAEAAREKLLKAADQLDNIQANSEATTASMAGMKTDVAALQANVTKLEADNAALRQQVADLQAALDQFKAEQIKARQTLIENVAAMIASGRDSGGSKSGKRKAAPSTEVAVQPATPEKSPDTPATTASLAPPPDTPSPSMTLSAGDNAPAAAPPKPQKGYYHVVASGETLTLIYEAYRENGVNVSLSAIRKANGLTEKSVLKTGQKLFIPSPARNL